MFQYKRNAIFRAPYFLLISTIFLAEAYKVEYSPVYHGDSVQPPAANQRQIADDDLGLIVEAGELGRIRGVQSYTLNTNRSFVQFLGIPYGEPPARFKPSSVKNGPLSESVFNATVFGTPCPQNDARSSEDCLHMNIAIPHPDTLPAMANNGLLPVIVFVHGAAFVDGNANAYTGARLLKRDVVQISFNYRLGIFGSFCLNTASAPCNAGLYDILTALRWVQKYIAHFGGDPDLVTLAGQSSGSASVSQLLVSPLSVGLFHRVMTLSGSAINEWATTTTGNPEDSSLQVADMLGCGCVPPNFVGIQSGFLCNVADLDAVAACMGTKTLVEIIREQVNYQSSERKAGRLGFDAVNPTVQAEPFPDWTPILPDLPINLLERQEQMNIPLMSGATKQDGAYGVTLLYVSYLLPNNLQNNATFLKTSLIPTMLKAIGVQDVTGGVYESLAKTYLSEEGRNSGNLTLMSPGLIDMSTVFYFKAAAYKTALLHSALNSTFLYSFDFKGTRTQHNPFLPFPGGVAHADDLIYVFSTTSSHEFNEEEQAVSDMLIDYWVNFAATGNPSIFPNGSTTTNPWPAFTEQSPNYLIIDEEPEIDSDYPGRWIGASNDLLNPPEDELTSTTEDELTTTTESRGAAISAAERTIVLILAAAILI